MKHVDVPAMMKQLHDEARPIVTRMTQEIGAAAETKSPHQVRPFAGLTASLVLQNIIISLAANATKPGSPEGAQAITNYYQQALRDALIRWHEPDLGPIINARKMEKKLTLVTS